MYSLARYSLSYSRMVMTEMPDHAWQPWNFVATTKNWYKELHDRYIALDPIALTILRCYVEVELRMTTSAGLSSVRIQTLAPTQRFQVQQLGGLQTIAKKLFPESPVRPKKGLRDPVWQSAMSTQAQSLV